MMDLAYIRGELYVERPPRVRAVKVTPENINELRKGLRVDLVTNSHGYQRLTFDNSPYVVAGKKHAEMGDYIILHPYRTNDVAFTIMEPKAFNDKYLLVSSDDDMLEKYLGEYYYLTERNYGPTVE
jgi:hypothetical protein